MAFADGPRQAAALVGSGGEIEREEIESFGEECDLLRERLLAVSDCGGGAPGEGEMVTRGKERM